MGESLTQRELQDLLEYDPPSGLWKWYKPARRSHKGWFLGSLSSDGYPRIYVKGKRYYSHRLAFLYMEGAFPDKVVDHINGKPDDNRWVNLRKADFAENSQNCSTYKNNTSGHKGVSFHKPSGKWAANIGINGKAKYLGLFDNFGQACEVAHLERLRVYGDYFRSESVV